MLLNRIPHQNSVYIPSLPDPSHILSSADDDDDDDDNNQR